MLIMAYINMLKTLGSVTKRKKKNHRCQCRYIFDRSGTDSEAYPVQKFQNRLAILLCEYKGAYCPTVCVSPGYTR